MLRTPVRLTAGVRPLVSRALAIMFGIASHHVRERLIGPLLLSLPWSHCASANATRTREHRGMPRLLSCRALVAASVQVWRFSCKSGMPSGAVPGLNLAVCPSAACSSVRGAKVPHATVRWAARPLAASARISGANARQRQAESEQIKQQLACARIPSVLKLTPFAA